MIDHDAVGVRYYAYPLAPELVDLAMDDPRPFLSEDPLADAWGLDGAVRPEMLYLDKCWDRLQRLTNPGGGATPARPCAVRGGRDAYAGRLDPWIDVLTPADVDDVTLDLALLDASDVSRR